MTSYPSTYIKSTIRKNNHLSYVKTVLRNIRHSRRIALLKIVITAIDLSLEESVKYSEITREEREKVLSVNSNEIKKNYGW